MGRRDRFDHICHLLAIAMVRSETWPRWSFFDLLKHVMASAPAASE